jgi:hypothetical protein
MTQEPFWKRELREVLIISSTFFVLFVLFMLLKKAFLAQQNIQLYAFGSALIGSLILGKVVLLTDKLPLTRKMDRHPKIFRLIFRSFVYLIGYVLFVFLEHIVKGLIMADGFSHAFSHAVHYLGERELVTSLVAVFIIFLFFNTFWIIRNHFGPRELYKLFFRKEG